MLKIKDNVDFNEFEKFGFKRKQWGLSEPNKCHWIYLDKTAHIIIREYGKYERKLIYVQSVKVRDLLYDLIISGIIEKPEE